MSKTKKGLSEYGKYVISVTMYTQFLLKESSADPDFF